MTRKIDDLMYIMKKLRRGFPRRQAHGIQGNKFTQVGSAAPVTPASWKAVVKLLNIFFTAYKCNPRKNHVPEWDRFCLVTFTTRWSGDFDIVIVISKTSTYLIRSCDVNSNTVLVVLILSGSVRKTLDCSLYLDNRPENLCDLNSWF